MLRNYFRIAARSLQRQKLFAAINIGGLALGIAAAFILGIYVKQELTYDQHFEGNDRVYRIATDFFEMGGFANSQQQLLDVLQAETSIIEAGTRFRGGRGLAVVVGNALFEEEDYLNVDTSFFRMFPYRFKAGSPATALLAPDGVVLSDRLAAKYFGETEALGQVVRIGKEQQPHRVTGVARTPPGKSHLAADLWLPLKLGSPGTLWTNAGYYNYVRLVEGNTQVDLEGALDQILRNHAYPASGFAGSYEQWAATPQSVRLWAQPLRDIYLHSDYNFELTAGGNPTQVYSLGLIGVLILLIAGMNYVNLTTAHSSARAKEVGVKKALGAGRPELVRQFLAESVTFSLFAMAFALVLAQGMLGAYTFITGETLVTTVFGDARQLLALAGVSILFGLAAGIYPALYLSNFRPVKILKGDWTLSGNHRLRGALVVVQFGIAIVLVISSLVVFRQLDFLQNTDKGFDHEGVLVVDQIEVLGGQEEAFRQQLEQMPQVELTSFSRRVPLGSRVRMYTYQTPEMAESVTIQNFVGDDKYIPTLGMRLIAGRNFSRELASDSSAAIINEAAARVLLLGDNPIGKEINEGETVIGVVSDFNFQSLKQHIEPVVLTYAETGDELAVKLRGGSVAGFVDRLTAVWQQFAPDAQLRFAFLDDRFAALAAKERILGKTISFFTLFAILIAAMGLFGLAAFTAARRTKEIGVRKVLGASVPGLAALLTKDFLVLVSIAFALAAPVAYFAMQRWLSDFAYHVEVGVGVFVLAGGAAAMVAVATVSYQAISAAMADPVKSLRYE